MRLLLDTHIAIWVLCDSPRLRDPARGLIADQRNSVFVSAASVWEIAIKHRLNRGGPDDMPVSGSVALEAFLQTGFEILAVTGEHAAALDGLPPIHKDPFDRLIVAQALAEPLILITNDAVVANYSSTGIQLV